MSKSRIWMNTQLSGWLISLILFFGFPPSVSAGNNPDQQPTTTEWVLTKRAPTRRSHTYGLAIACAQLRNFGWLWFYKIIHRLKLFTRHVITQTFENFRLTYSIEYIQSKHIAFAYCSTNFKGLHLPRG